MEMWERMRLILGVWLLSSACAFNVYFEYRKKHFHICDPAKAGSTSLSTTMYLAMSGDQEYPLHCYTKNPGGYVMNFKCGWDKIPTFKVLLLSDHATFTPHPKRLPFVNYSMIVVRDPLHRIVSAWRSKIRPALCVSETDSKIDIRLKGMLAKQGKNMTFVSFTQFVLSHLHLNEWKNAHWDPQIDICGSPYHYQTRLKLEELNETSFNDLSHATGVTMKLSQHGMYSNKTRGYRESNASHRPHDKLLDLTLDKIYNYYHEDYTRYGYIQNRTADVAFLAKVFSQFPEECF